MHNQSYYTIFQGKMEWKSSWIWQNNLRITLSLFTPHPILLEALKSVINNNTHFVPEIYTSGGIYLFRDNIYFITKFLVGLNLRCNFIHTVDDGCVILFAQKLTYISEGSIR